VAIEPSGRVVASASVEHQPFTSPQPGWAEQDPHDWWAACGAAVQSLAQQGVRKDEIACIGFSGQMHGAVLLDGEDQVIRPAIIWCDQRTEEQVRELTDSIGVDRLIRATCNPPLTNFTLTKLLWVREHEPHRWKRFQHLLLPKDYVRFRLTGERAMDVADASGTLLLDVANRRWSSEVVRETRVPGESLPTLYESPEVCGQVSAQGAEATGLKPGTPVVAGAGDQAAGAVGMGIARPGAVSATIGTSGVVFAATERPALDLHGRIHTFCHAIPGRWHVMGVTQAAGLSLQWFANQFAKDLQNDPDRYTHLSTEASKVPVGGEGLYWLPYLMGERTPHLDPHARGVLLGMTASHTRAHVVRAILEGVAFSLKDSFSIFDELGVPVERIRLGGGGARSPLWRQIQADVYQRTVEVVEAEEGAAYGAAILAGVGAKVWPTVDEACDAVVRVAQQIAPEPQAAVVMQKNYRIYRKIYPALRDLFGEKYQQ
jgi:xylulokinase